MSALLESDARLLGSVFENAKKNLSSLKGKTVRIGGTAVKVTDVRGGRIYAGEGGVEMAFDADRLGEDALVKLGLASLEQPKAQARANALHAFYFRTSKEATRALMDAEEAGEDLSFYLSRMTPILVVTTTPSDAEVELRKMVDGAWVMVDLPAGKAGEKKRTAPFRLEVEQNTTYQVQATKEGYESVTREVKVGEAGEYRVKVTAERLRLPPSLAKDFEVPKESKDRYGNPIRKGFDKQTGLPIEIRHKQTGMHFVFIPPGEFLMGSPDNEKDRDASREGPQHKVRLTKPSYLGKYEVTQAEWKAVTGSNPSQFQSDRNPVEMVSWDDCQGFIKKLNSRLPSPSRTSSSSLLPSPGGRGAGGEGPAGQAQTQEAWQFALPTAAQWEYACRAGTQTRFYFGDDLDYKQLPDYAWFNANSGAKTHPVGEKKPNGWGLYDTSRNVWEWCEDWYGAYAQEAVTDPTGPDRVGNRVFRGGSWNDVGRGCRSASRNYSTPANRFGYLGCRLSLRPYPLNVFEIPTESKDKYGNPIRKGFDKKTELPLEIRHKQTGMHFVFIPPGEFLMGSPDDERDRDASREGPLHNVRLTKPFYLGKYEVTQAEWKAVMGNNPSKFEGDRNPVEQVSWNDCQTFVKRLESAIGNRQSGFRFVLPTDAQWEYACRAGTRTRFYYGDDLDYETLRHYAWFKVNAGAKTHPVGEKRPNAWGLYGMSGNASEWCQDCYGSYAKETVSNPTGPDRGSPVIRGGSWLDTGAICRSAYRNHAASSYLYHHLGCRLALRSTAGR